ncbi:hypothetical protein L6452_18357 [Arctium lappa]|uniref:Uncharacterized protein n=1 Tax=Arctium lappa TaxID=4217 RepID=A0ACB9C5Y8_ARCLA|nr:hypothetical protein L6452_18357 [Arctium lappa]
MTPEAPVLSLIIRFERESMAAADRLLKRLERLRNKADRMAMDVSVGYEYAPLIASSSFKLLCKKAMSVCIIDPLWRIVHLSAPELIAFLLEEEGYASLDDSDEEFVVFDVLSRRLLESGFTQRQLELLSLAGRLPSKRNIGEEETVVGYGRVSSAFSPVAAAESKTYPSHGRSFEYSTQHVNFVFCCPIELGESFQVGRPFDYETYKFLRILDMESTSIFSFPREVTKIVNLRYLAIQAYDGNPPASLSNLVHLQTLIISSRRNIVVPTSTWDMECLRHLYIKSGENLIEDVSSDKFLGNDCYDRVLDGLQTISGVFPSPSCLDILSRTPNLRKLGFCGPLVSTLGVLEFPNICYLNCLQRLKLSNTKIYHAAVKSCSPLMFPETLRRLTLSDTALDWNEIRTIGLLPNLEVLKLNVNACIGQKWETSDMGFANLKLLKLQELDIVKWEASSAHFPRLQRLVVRCCSRLQQIPASIGEILPLELIEVSWCGESTSQSARTIQKEQERNGNDFLKVITSVHRDLQGKRKRPSYE